MRVVTGPGGNCFRVGFHAIEQWRERVCPALDLADAEARLRERLRVAERHLVAPDWAREFVHSQVPDEWLVLAEEGAVFPVSQGVIKTCLCRVRVGAQVRFVR